MLHKTFNLIDTKADGDDGTFEALVSVFNNVDSVGDRVQPGAFAKSLEQWAATGDPIPVILSHQWNDPMAHIGVVYPGDAKEVERGLAVKGHLDVNDNQVAKQVHKLMKRRSLKEFSFGYRVVKEKTAKDGANELQEVDLIEIGPTLKGANPDTELTAVKSALEAEQKPEEPPSEADLRKKERELRLEEATEDVPKGTPPAPDPVATLHTKVDDISKDFETFKVEVTKSLEGIRAAVEEPKPVSAAKHDSLRQRSNQAVLEIQSDGISLRRPPTVRQEPELAPSEAELKARSRREMLELLTGVSNDEE